MEQKSAQKDGTVVACCGAFDGEIHPGHINFLKKAREEGNTLHAFIVPDEVIVRNKKRRPIHLQAERVNHVSVLGIAHEVTALVGSDENQLAQIEALYPNVFCLGEDQTTRFIKELVQRLDKYGTKFIRIPRYQPELYSTTNQLQRN